MVGETATYTATGTDNAPAVADHYRFTYDGFDAFPEQDGPSKNWTLTFGQQGFATVVVQYYDGEAADHFAQDNLNIEVVPQLTASVSSSEESPAAGSPVTFTASASGGYSTLSYAWDTDGDGFDDGSGQSITTSFAAAGAHEVRVQVSDSASPVHTVVAGETVNVTQGCTQQAAFGIVEITTQGCLYLQSYRSTRLLPTRAAGAATGVRIPRGTPATALRIVGRNGPPKVTVTGPDGTKIVSPADAAAAERKGKWMLVENPSDGSTSVLLVKPAGGTWTVDGDGVKSVDTAGFQQPSTVNGAVTHRRGKHEVHVAYSLPRGAKLSLVERGRCAADDRQARARPRLPGRLVRPARPARAVRARALQAELRPGRQAAHPRGDRAGRDAARREQGRDFQGGQAEAGEAPGRLRVVRKKGAVIAAWKRPAGSVETIAYARLSDGRRLTFELGRRCSAVRIGRLSRNVSVTVQAYGLRQDMEGGRVATVRLKARRTRAGARGDLPRRICR